MIVRAARELEVGDRFQFAGRYLVVADVWVEHDIVLAVYGRRAHNRMGVQGTLRLRPMEPVACLG